MEEVTREKTRIYVGGLGGGVTEEDLRKTFSSLGEVIAVDIVRTKDRSLAYLDFLPSSDKSLPKLFSTYNGCMWKGGKMRLEKAKEHYLDRLKREWQEQSELANKISDSCNADVAKSHNTLEKPKKPSPADKTQFNIFFPKLGKVKSLAQVGIGKHKYSFQRIQVPDIPTHFCDCEEHSLAFPPPVKKQSSEFENASYAINEQELDIMNSVMNKIFERANPSKQVSRKSESKNGKDEMVDVENDEEDNVSDEDNLIINVANGKSDTMDLVGEMRSMMANRELVANSQTTSTENSKSQKKLPLTKKRKSPHSEEHISIKTPNPETSKISQTRSDTKKDSKTKVDSENNSLRALKSSWKGLIGQTRKTSFNISNFIATMPQRKEEPTTEVDEVTANISIPDILTNDCQQKEERKVDNIDFPLTLIGQQAGGFDQKEDQPTTDDLYCNFENLENLENTDSRLDNSNDVKKPSDEALIRTARGEFWRHKSSWTQLISTTSHTSFSISQIVPDVNFEKLEQKTDTFSSQPENTSFDRDQSLAGKEVTLLPVKKKTFEKRRKLESDGTCSFMRTDESMKEWKKAKTSHSSSLNKKKKEANESA